MTAVKRAINRYGKEFAAIVGLAIVGIAVTAYILPQMRFTLPGWVPGIGTDFTEYKVQLATAQSVTPGQGQTVQIAGVDVGEMTKVDLVGGRAVVTVKVDPDHPLYRDATANLRPKTGLNDMVLQVDPGTKQAGKAPEGFTIPVDRTETPVQLEELWAALDADTRASLQMLLGAGAEAFRDNGRQTSNTLRRIEPLGRDTARLTRPAQRALARTSSARCTTSGCWPRRSGEKDDDLASFVDSNNAVFRSFARQDARAARDHPRAAVRAALDELGADQGRAARPLAGPDAGRPAARPRAASGPRCAPRGRSWSSRGRSSATSCGRSPARSSRPRELIRASRARAWRR